MTCRLTRRGALAAGLSAAFLSSRGFAAAPDRKLIVVIARGAMDGLTLAPPIGDPAYPALRGEIAIPAEATLRLDADFGLHPKLQGLHTLVQAGQARIAPAVALPERLRSHFEAQDLLENGGPRLFASTTGWLNRALSSGSPRVKALAVGAQTPLILRGPVQAQSWSPGLGLPDSADRLVSALQDLYAGDPLLAPAFASGLQTEAMAESFGDGPAGRPRDPAAFARTTARFLAEPTGPQVAVLSLDGFDTHARQGGVEGQLAQRLQALDAVIMGLRDGLGVHWKETALVVVTEFGRTARVNGTGGTDHGTASALILAGGALKPGGLVGDWPGLSGARLFEGRDLAPTLDVRSIFKGLLVDHLGLDRQAVETAVFPDSVAAPALRGLVA
jgi:uncharacterized protein (DUF1501 family)